MFWLLVLLAVAAEIIGDVLFRMSALRSQLWLLWLGYVVGSGLWAWSLRYHELGKAIVVFAVVNAGLCVLAG